MGILLGWQDIPANFSHPHLLALQEIFDLVGASHEMIGNAARKTGEALLIDAPDRCS